MINKDQYIPCQVCNTPVPFDTNQFLRGVSFSCPNPKCDARYGLPMASRGVVRDTMDQLEKLKSGHH